MPVTYIGRSVGDDLWLNNWAEPSAFATTCADGPRFIGPAFILTDLDRTHMMIGVIGETSSRPDEKPVIFFDIDNTLYSANSKISQAMGTKIHNYFVSIGLSHDEAADLHLKYYTQYGLALRGLTRHHDVDPLDFDRQCDQALPLEQMISYDKKVRKLFEDIDRSKFRVWALTNAYRIHAERVLQILSLQDLIDGLIYCDYVLKDFSCKPEPEFYREAMKQAKITDPSKCYFVDDNRKNVDAARALGWGHCVHFCELGLEVMEGGKIKEIDDAREPGAIDNGVIDITTLDELRTVWPEMFREE